MKIALTVTDYEANLVISLRKTKESEVGGPKMRKSLSLFLVSLLIAIVSVGAAAQSVTGSISGVVADERGAVVPTSRRETSVPVCREQLRPTAKDVLSS